MKTPWGRILESNSLRKTVLDLAKFGNAVHIGPSFSLIEILAVLYERFIRIDWDNPKGEDRDILALSKGHGVMALYACFREFSWINDQHIKGYLGPNNKLKGLSSVHVQGVEVSGGSLGHGLPVSVGMALGQKINRSGNNVFCIVGDGEMNEGSNWEALSLAVQHKLDNLLVIVDFNKFQAMGTTDEILCQKELREKFNSFGFKALQVNGHDREILTETISSLLNNKNGQPSVIIAETTKGKGVSFMEENNVWHYARLDEDTYLKATRELGYA